MFSELNKREFGIELVLKPQRILRDYSLEIFNKIELLKNSIVEFNKTTSIDSFHTTEIDGELIFQQL
ncbi:conserved hypothetical protein [Leptospira interrogans serovar Manilae]|uniref:Uncharacterized protein n=1 Tax=Leptospira interrogans serovar Manilae TaxID=214675 RepID=A0AAQ1NUZ3_LEPIR|nr:hypothetical protein LIMLP_14070 [Leptospira interrogans serovar Manilae]AKP30725.1 hypothetical protein LIMHP_14065 [Leptospira interrogans serovar Manilae]EYU64748.1 hypothetical protein CI00_05035 [Leptospira interrogans serovar Manilae]SOR60513.1 conserved hypothetical protein [Leptospira interrogans serovar Manilae]